jgi:hypothetical protein
MTGILRAPATVKIRSFAQPCEKWQYKLDDVILYKLKNQELSDFFLAYHENS